MRNNPTSMSFQMRAFYDAIETVIHARDTKLSLPIPHIPLPTKDSHLPNAGRPYRGDSTDGIHHGWDVYTDRGTPVRAVDDGVIFHIYRDFTWDDMKKLHPADSHLEEQENLDIYRGNTVYLKTNSGNVAIYAHLDDIPKDLAVGQRVTRGAIVGHVGDSAVPDKKYLYHLHFEIAMNPYVDRRAGEY
jgi:murein DD-endopeptidase MepM/ murein hydrolase activator NlpD